MELTPTKRQAENNGKKIEDSAPAAKLQKVSHDEGERAETASPSKSANTPVPADPITPSSSHRNGSSGASDGLSAKQKKQAEKELEKQRKAAEREAERRRKEKEKEAEKLRKEAERTAERLKKEAEREAERLRKENEKSRKEADRKAEKERKEAEKLADKERKEAERIADKERKEAEKRAEEEKQRASQPRINSFFTKKPALKPSKKAKAPDTTDSPSLTAYSKTFLSYAPKSNSQVFNGVCSERSRQDPAQWLKSQQACTDKSMEALTVSEFRTRLAAASTPEEILELLGQLRTRHLQFYENNRPPYVGSTPDIERNNVLKLAIDPSRIDLVPSLVYDYDSDAEWVDEEDGEEIGDDNLSDDDGETDASMDEFIAEEDESDPQRRPITVGPVTPVVQWGPGSDITEYPIELLVPSISPFEKKAEPARPKTVVDALSISQGSPSSSTPGLSPSSQETTPMAPPSMDPLLMNKLLAKVHGSEGNQTLLIELLRRDFPDMKKATIVQTVKACAQRVGSKEKKWEVLPQYLQLLSQSDTKVKSS